MEHLKYIFSELSDTFKDAWTEINKKIPARRTTFSTDNDNGYDIPIEFTLRSVELATNIMNELIPYNTIYEDTINDNSHINKRLHALTHTSQKPPNTDNKIFHSKRNSDHYEKKQISKDTMSRSASSLPPRESVDSTCRACGKARYDIFTTGCDQFAI